MSATLLISWRVRCAKPTSFFDACGWRGYRLLDRDARQRYLDGRYWRTDPCPWCGGEVIPLSPKVEKPCP